MGGPTVQLTGTPGYQAPELLKGEAPSRACDVYSLGILLWQLDSRTVPYAGQHPQVVMFQVVSMVARPKPPPLSTAAVVCRPSPSSTQHAGLLRLVKGLTWTMFQEVLQR